MIVMDDIGFDGAAGIHVDKDHQPYALITSSDDKDVWSLTASHELLEMLVDPFGNRLVAGDSPKKDQGRVMFLVEVCDPSEAAEFGYTVNGVRVSDFYTPHFFDPVAASGVRYSYTDAITEPRKILSGGYLSWMDPTTNHWWQEYWFSGSGPSFRDLGQLSADQGSLRSQIDRLTGKETNESVNKERSVTMAAGLPCKVNNQSTQARANSWRQQIQGIIAQSTTHTAAAAATRRSAGRVRRDRSGE
jgi:hypothetical protein